MGSETPYSILTVDDNEATRYSTSRVLKGAGFRVIEAADGTEALKQAHQNPDLIILDVNLPDLNGFDVCRELRKRPEMARTPVIYLSAAYVSMAHKVEGLEAGADGYLIHPVEPPVLIATVNAFLRARKAEDAMRRSEARFRTIFEQVRHGMALMTPDLQFVEVNPALCHALQCPREQLMGASLSRFINPGAPLSIEKMQESMLSAGTYSGTFPLTGAAGQSLQMEWNITTLSDSEAWLATVIDVTERLKIEEERERSLEREKAARSSAELANRIKDDFLATLSHELRTPLSSILGWGQLLALGKCTPVEIAAGAEVIQRNAKIQSQLIADLLDVSRIAAGKMQLDLELLHPGEVVTAALESVNAAAIAKDIEIVCNFEPDTGLALADPARLQQVIWNLITNAVKFTPRNGRIELSIRQAGDQIEIEVSDTGQGISPDFLPFIFDRFRQEDSRAARSHGGLGLGLAIVRQLIELHGGNVSATSEGLGRGATFLVTLPVSARSTAVPVNETDPVEPLRETASGNWRRVDLRQSKILVVDDDQDVRTIVIRILRECGADTAEAGSAAEALLLAESWQPELLVSDIGMPREDGYDLIRELRVRGFDEQKLPAIALTAFARAVDRDRALYAGYQRHLQKPVDPLELVSRIAELLGRPGH